MKAKSIDCHNLELICQSNPLLFDQPGSWNWLRQIGKFLVDSFSKSYELKIEQITDRDGNASWQVYDPIKRQALWFCSEAEVRIWLDQRFS